MWEEALRPDFRPSHGDPRVGAGRASSPSLVPWPHPLPPRPQISPHTAANEQITQRPLTSAARRGKSTGQPWALRVKGGSHLREEEREETGVLLGWQSKSGLGESKKGEWSEMGTRDNLLSIYCVQTLGSHSTGILSFNPHNHCVRLRLCLPMGQTARLQGCPCWPCTVSRVLNSLLDDRSICRWFFFFVK